MIQKKKLLSAIGELLEMEQSLVPLLGRHVASSLSFSGLKEGDRKSLLKYFESRAVVQAKHAAVLKELRGEVIADSADVH